MNLLAILFAIAQAVVLVVLLAVLNSGKWPTKDTKPSEAESISGDLGK